MEGKEWFIEQPEGRRYE